MNQNIKEFIRKHPFLTGTIFLIGSLPLILHFVFWGLVSAKAPKYSGEIRHPYISSKVTVTRDGHGIPHIRGEDAKSAYFALGYTMAQDRIFQMELQRRIGRGELSGIFGDALVPSDKFLKSLLLKKTAEEYVAEKSKLVPEAWEELDYFLTGVNAFLETGNLPIEFSILGIKPRPFDRVDAISFLFYMGFSFAEGIKSDSLYTILEKEIQGRIVSELFPRYDFEVNASILDSQPGFPKVSYNRNLFEKKSKVSVSYSGQKVPNGFDSEKLGEFLSQFDKLQFPIQPMEGSNSWVIGPSRSTSGGAILANDPHIALSNPGAWYEAHIQFPGYENYGYFLSIVPFPLIAHNKEKAWALTMLEQDDVNLYFETIEDDKFLYKNSWVPLQIVSDPILQKDGKEIPFSVKITNHGPIITEFIQGYKGRPISLYWANHHLKNPLLDVLYKMGRANSFSELDSASSLIAAPGLNFSYADKNGNIAYYSVGRFPILKSGNSRKILEGTTGDEDVIGYVSPSNNPKMVNPKNGIIVTANNLVTTNNLSGLGKPEGNWQPPDRFQRIVSVLETKEKWSLEELAALQNDTVSSFAPEYLEILLQNTKQPKTLAGKQVLEKLKAWNFEHETESSGAAVYDVFFYTTLKLCLIDELGKDRFELYGEFAEYWNAYRKLVRTPDSRFWDDQSTVGVVETREDIFQKSLDETGAYLESKISKSPSLWTWKHLYKVKHPHPLGVLPMIGAIFNIGPHPSKGGSEVVNNLKYKLMREDWTATSGPSKRRVIDFGRFSESVTQLPIGNSGNLASPFYGNMVEDYIQGRARKILFSKEEIGDGKFQLTFLPKP